MKLSPFDWFAIGLIVALMFSIAYLLGNIGLELEVGR